MKTQTQLRKPLGKKLIEAIARVNYFVFFWQMLKMQVASLHVEWWLILKRWRRVCILAPRISGKSEFFVVGYVLWHIYYAKTPLIYIFSDSSDQGEKLLDRVVAYIENRVQRETIDGETYKVEFGNRFKHLKPDSPRIWHRKEKEFSTGVRVVVKGFGSSVRGPHPGLIIVDDALNDENSASPPLRAKTEQYFFSTISNMLLMHGQLVVVGTTQNEDDLLHVLLQNPVYYGKVYKAILNYKTKEVLLPNRWPFEALLLKKKEIGALPFAKEFQNEPVAEEASLFPWILLRTAKDPIYIAPRSHRGAPNLRTYCGCDFSIPGAKKDWTCIVTIGLSPGENYKIYLLDIFRGRGLSFAQQVLVVEERCNLYGIELGLVEANVFQMIYHDNLRETNLPLRPVIVSGSGKTSFTAGVPSILVLFENERVVFPYHVDDPRGRAMTDILCTELHGLHLQGGKILSTAAHDDVVMAFWHAITASRQATGKVRYGPNVFLKRGKRTPEVSHF